MLEALCEKLKEARQEKGFDLEEVVEKTKLHPSVIKYIEAGDLDNINPIYLKGYLKIYASFLGVSIGDELQGLVPKKEKKAARIKPDKPPKDKKRRIDFSKIFTPQVKRNIALGAMITLASALLIFFSISLVNIIKNKIASLPKKESILDLPKQSRSSRTPAKEAPAAEVSVSLRIKRDCFVRVKLDGNLVFEGVLRKGVVESWEAKKEIEFKISDASSVDLEVGGQLYAPLSKIRKPIKSLKVTSEGIFIDK